MNTIAALEIKRCGISVIDKQMASGPVHVIKNNRPQYVVMTEDRYQNMMDEMNEVWELRILTSLDEAASGKAHRGSADELIHEIFSDT